MSSSGNNRHAIHSQSEEFDNARDKHLTVGHCRFKAYGADPRGHEISAGLYFRSLNIVFSWDHRTFQIKEGLYFRRNIVQ